MPIGSNLGIYAALAEIPPSPDGGLPKLTPFAPRPSLALPRWLHSIHLREKIPVPSLAILFTLRPGHVTSNLRTLRPRLPDRSDGRTYASAGLRGARG